VKLTESVHEARSVLGDRLPLGKLFPPVEEASDLDTPHRSLDLGKSKLVERDGHLSGPAFFVDSDLCVPDGVQ